MIHFSLEKMQKILAYLYNHHFCYNYMLPVHLQRIAFPNFYAAAIRLSLFPWIRCVMEKVICPIILLMSSSLRILVT